MDEIQKAMTSNRGYDWKPSKNFKDERLTDSEIGLQVALCLMDYRNDKIDETEVRITNNILSISIQHNDRMGRNVMESVKDANDFIDCFHQDTVDHA